MADKRKKSPFIQTFGIVVMVLALVRCAFPGIAGTDSAEAGLTGNDTAETGLTGTDIASAEDRLSSSHSDNQVQPEAESPASDDLRQETPDLATASSSSEQSEVAYSAPSTTVSRNYLKDGEAPHPILSVPSYDTCFPDSNHVQLVAAQKWGVKPVKNRVEAEKRKDDLVYAALSPYYNVDNLTSSIPYLVPRAAILLQDIGQAFYDSLQVKGIPLHRLLVTSMLRTHADVKSLRRSNGNATEHSCHLYGTTFDISYVTFRPVESPDGPRRRTVRDDSLKFVLSEVLNDMRQQGRCYIKYERRQSCYHMTVR